MTQVYDTVPYIDLAIRRIVSDIIDQDLREYIDLPCSRKSHAMTFLNLMVSAELEEIRETIFPMQEDAHIRDLFPDSKETLTHLLSEDPDLLIDDLVAHLTETIVVHCVLRYKVFPTDIFIATTDGDVIILLGGHYDEA